MFFIENNSLKSSTVENISSFHNFIPGIFIIPWVTISSCTSALLLMLLSHSTYSLLFFISLLHLYIYWFNLWGFNIVGILFWNVHHVRVCAKPPSPSSSYGFGCCTCHRATIIYEKNNNTPLYELAAGCCLIISSSSCNFSSLPLLHTCMHAFICHQLHLKFNVSLFFLYWQIRRRGKIMRKTEKMLQITIGGVCITYTKMFAYHTCANCCFYRNHTLIVIKIHFHIFLFFFFINLHTLFWCFPLLIPQEKIVEKAKRFYCYDCNYCCSR